MNPTLNLIAYCPDFLARRYYLFSLLLTACYQKHYGISNNTKLDTFGPSLIGCHESSRVYSARYCSLGIILKRALLPSGRERSVMFHGICSYTETVVAIPPVPLHWLHPFSTVIEFLIRLFAVCLCFIQFFCFQNCSHPPKHASNCFITARD